MTPTRQHSLKENPHRQPCEMLTKTDMHALPKGHGRPCSAVETKPVRTVKDCLVPATGQIAQHQPVSCCDAASVHLGVPGCGPHEVLHGRGPAHGFFD